MKNKTGSKTIRQSKNVLIRLKKGFSFFLKVFFLKHTYVQNFRGVKFFNIEDLIREPKRRKVDNGI